MLKEIAHFVRMGVELIPMQKQHSRAEFLDMINTRADSEGYAEVRRELVGDLSGRVLEVGCGTGSMFRYYGDAVEVDAIEPEQDFLELAVAKAPQMAVTVRAAAGDGMNLDFPDGTFDAEDSVGHVYLRAQP